MTSEELIRSLDQRKQRGEELPRTVMDELLQGAEEERAAIRKEQEDTKQRRSVMTTEVPWHGTWSAAGKTDDDLTFVSVNVNSLAYWSSESNKAERLKDMFQKCKIDSAGLQEVCMNWAQLPPSKTLAQILRNSIEQIRSVASHNKIEGKETGAGKVQRGGTATLLRDELTAYVKDSGVDPSSLGRWSWYLLQGGEGFSTRVVTAYAPTGSAASRKETYYKQQERYIKTKGLKTNPKAMFREDLLSQLRKWRSNGDRVILMMDANEDVVDGVMCRQLGGEDLKMREAVHSTTRERGPKTHFKGSIAIDGIWVSEEIGINQAAYMPFDAELGDHRPVVANLSKKSILGVEGPRIKPQAARRLNAKVKRIRQKYIDTLEEAFQKHRVLDKIKRLETETQNGELSTEARAALNKIDKQITELMTCAEKRCRMLFKNDYEFSPKVRYWIERGRAIRALIKLKLGRECNEGNVKRAARRAGIENPLSYNRRELHDLYHACKQRCKEMLASSPWLRKQFLNRKLQDALDEGKQEEAKQIKDILRNERQRANWRNIDKEMGKTRTPAPTMVETVDDQGVKTQHRTKEEVEDAIHEEIGTRFGRASSAAICSGPLFELLGYNADTEAGMQILEGTFVPPAGTDPATVIILKEIARIWRLMGEGEVSIIITREDFQHYWKKMKERTASSFSGRHFGHYISAAHSELLSEVHARHLALVTKTGAAPERWSRGLSVMLEKIAGVAVVTKLRAILLMEADFNCHNRIMFGDRMLKLARENGLVPEEIYSEKGKTPEDAILQQVLLFDIARQLRRPLLVASVDAAQCYDRIAHAVAALTLRAYKVRRSSVAAMLQPIQAMEYYLRTGFGESATYAGGKEDPKQGMCQGNTAAPPTWQQISTLLVNAQRHEGHGISIVSPISKKRRDQVGVLFVDDTNLWEGLGEDDDLESTINKGQKSINCWGNNLLAVGGELKPEKCFYTVHSMRPGKDGEWEYVTESRRQEQQPTEDAGESELDDLWDDMSEDELDTMPPFRQDEATADTDQDVLDSEVTVPLIGGDQAAIKRLTTAECEKNLGLRVRPDGDCSTQLGVIQEKAEAWSGRIKAGCLPARAVWMSYTQQLWSSIKYGLGACSASLEDLETTLRRDDFYLISRLGVARNIPVPLRYMPSHFGGMDLNYLPTETTVAQINCLLQHYGTDTALGDTLTAALEHLQVEIGVEGCPLEYSYERYGGLATDTWAKSLWEKVDAYGIEIHMTYHRPKPPRGPTDRCIMEVFAADKTISPRTLRSLNRTRKYQQAIYVSDLATAKGDKIDAGLLTDWRESHEGTLGRHRSSVTFGREIPSAADWNTWARELSKLHTPSLHLLTPLGSWTGPSPRVWRYYYGRDADKLVVKTDQGMESYVRRDGPGRRYVRDETDTDHGGVLQPVTVEEQADGSLKIKDIGDGMAEEEDNTHESFMEHLRAYGGEWFWEDVRAPDGTDWIKDAMEAGTITCVADGSYIPHLDKQVSGAGWIIMDRESRKRVAGALAERSADAGSYRGELLGMLAIRTFLLAIESYYRPGTSNGSSGKLSCDCKSALHTFSKKNKRITSTASNADIRRSLREVQRRTMRKFSLEHVRGHQDKYKRLRDLPLEARMNVECDGMAKGAVRLGAEAGKGTGPCRLPLEHACVVIAGRKQTSDPGRDLRRQIGTVFAKQYYTTRERRKGGMDEETFDLIAWDDVERGLRGTSKMFKIWHAKQGSGYCGVGYWTSKYKEGSDSRCPSCGMLDETAAHLNRCRNKGRAEVFELEVRKIERWMESTYTHPLLEKWIPVYLRYKGKKAFQDLPGLPREMKRLAEEQDKIGWTNFAEGRVTKSIRHLQTMYMHNRGSTYTEDHWMKEFVRNLMLLTHEQWLARNLMKHHFDRGSAAIATRAELEEKIHAILEKDFHNIAEKDRWILDLDMADCEDMSVRELQYTVFELEASQALDKATWERSGGTTRDFGQYCQEVGSEAPTKISFVSDGSHREEREKARKDRDAAAKTKSQTTGKRQRVDKRTLKQALGKRGKPESTAGRSTKKAAKTQPSSQRRTDGLAFQNSIATRAAREGDDLNALAEVTVPRHEGKAVTAMLNRGHSGEDQAEPVASRTEPTVASVSKASIRTLAEGQWINDEVMNYVSQVLIVPRRRASQRKAHAFSTFFMDALLSGTRSMERYDFERVRNYDRSIEGGLWGLDDLLIPVNVDNAHWLFAHTDISAKRVHLYDSMGRQQANDDILEATIRYLYDATNKGVERSEAAPFEEWRLDWSVADESHRSPRQGNGFDCGLFTLISMGLIRNGVALQRSSYSQDTLYRMKSRRRLAWMIWRSGIGASGERWTPREPDYTTRDRQTSTAGAPQGPRGRGRKKRRVDNRIVLGGVRMRSLLKWYEKTQREKDSGTGGKRKARSVAEEEGERGIARRILAPPRKRGKGSKVGR